MFGIQREQQHTAEVVKLKSAKEAAEAKQAQIQRSMKEEMERFRTQMTFRVIQMTYTTTQSN